ncbi:efflux RND transporter permease subunit [Radicibacter daui]|uniref:efflux RND transporter permease subunit n=1 Tax=Radicibacter daui TaxID=3064829 RepID=UPI0040469F66
MRSPNFDIAALSVRRPVLATVINLLIVVAGLAAMTAVEVRELPNVDRPIITVRASFTGAAPETIDAQVTSVIEGAVSRVAGVSSISSTSSFGQSRITVEFQPSVKLDVAASDMRDAVASVQGRLPDDVDPPTVVKANNDDQPIIRLAVTSPTLDAAALTTLVEDEISDTFAAVPGVADVQINGEREDQVRVFLDTIALASRGISLGHLGDVLTDAAFDTPAGNFDTSSQTLVVRANASATTAAAIEALPLSPTTRVGDVASVVIGPEDPTSYVRLDGNPVVGLGILRQAQSNTIDISQNVDRVIAQLNASHKDISIYKTADDALFIQGSIDEVTRAIGLSVLIVTAVIYAFMASLRLTFIPTITMPVALIGTVAVIWLVGFSINNLTLLALVLATGLVVDDAIVVLENIERFRAAGIGRSAAAVLGTRQVFFAVLATTATLASVFVPISFMQGTAGRLFTEFGYALAISVTISAVVALTLCPMLASRLGGKDGHKPLPRWLAAFGRFWGRLYTFLLDRALGAPFVALALAGLVIVAAALAYSNVQEELLPSEDRGSMLISLTAPQGSGIDFTDAQARKVEALVEPLLKQGVAQHVYTLVGRGDTNRAFVIVTLAPWQERSISQQEIVRQLRPKLGAIPGAQVALLSPNSLGIRGGGRGLQFALVGSNYEQLADLANRMAVEARSANPGFDSASISYDPSQPQLSVEINRERAADLGIDIKSIATALKSMVNSNDLGDLYVGDKALPIMVEPQGGVINDPSDLLNVFVDAAGGRVLPLSSVITLKETSTAPSLARESTRRAVTVTMSLAPDFPLRKAMDAASAAAAKILPAGVRLTFIGEAATLNQTSSGVATTFAVALVVVILVLAAQFESFASAFVVISTVPFGVAAAILALLFTGTTLNIYSQIGLVMLVGLMAKNGILIVEFANQLRDGGMSVREAVRNAAIVRLRPVLMTMIATVVGGVPLVISHGPGAEAREAIGWLVVGGLGFATIFTLFLTPVFYLLIARFSKAKGDIDRHLEGELAAAATIHVAEEGEKVS